MVARRRTRLGADGPADSDGYAGVARCGRHRHQPGNGDFYMPQQTAGSFLVPLTGAVLAGMPQKDDHRARQRLPELRDPLQIRQRQDRLQAAGKYRVPPVLDQDAGPHAEHLCQRMLHGRACGRSRKQTRSHSSRNISTTNAASNCSSGWPRFRNGRRGHLPIAAVGRCLDGPRHVLCEIRTCPHVCRRGRRCGGEPRHRQGPGAAFYLVQDCGQIINPDGVKAQLDGNVIQTISRTLIEEVKWNRSMVTTLDWASYPILTFPEVPELVYRPDRPPERAALGRRRARGGSRPIRDRQLRFRDATGVRMRSVPFTPGR